MRIAGVEEKKQTIEVLVKANVSWRDYRLSWNASEHGGITKVALTRDAVWRPAVLPCSYLGLTADDNGKGLVMVNSSGHVQDVVTLSYVAPLLALDELNVVLDGGGFRRYANIEAGSEWEITMPLHLMSTNSTSKIVFTITLERYSHFWVNLVILPCFVLGFLIIAGLVLNGDNPTIESVVNIGLASTVSTAVIISTMTDNFPKTNRIPSLGSFVRNQILIILAAIVTLSIRRSLMNTIEMLINFLEIEINKSYVPKWRKFLVAAIKFAKYKYFLFIIFELAHLACFLYMMRHATWFKVIQEFFNLEEVMYYLPSRR